MVRSPSAPLDHFEICVKKADIGKTAYVEDLIVMVGKMKYPFVLGEEIKSIQDAIIKPWAITLNDKVFHFSVKLYRYARFRPLALLERHNILDYLNRVKAEDTRYVETTEEEMYEQMTVRDKFPSQGESFILKKTNFCNRVCLTRSEWIAGFQEISLNTSKEVFDSNKTLGDSEFDIFLNEQGEPTGRDMCGRLQPRLPRAPSESNSCQVVFWCVARVYAGTFYVEVTLILIKFSAEPQKKQYTLYSVISYPPSLIK